MEVECQEQQMQVSIPITKDGKPMFVAYATYCDSVADKQWVIKKLVRALVIAIFLLVVSNLAWLYVWQSYDYSSTETTLESDGNSIANFTGGNGGVRIGGTSDVQEDSATQE